MFTSLVLIINESENARVYINKLKQDSTVSFEIATSEDESIDKAIMLEPDLILIPSKFRDSNGFELCKKIREHDFITRPVIVIVSESIADDRPSSVIEALKYEADDFLISTIADEELCLRLYAHLRRHIEALSDNLTKLPGSKLINTNLKRIISFDKTWALMLLSINNLKYYQEIYGYLAANQLIKAFIAISKSNLEEGDFIGHVGKLDFAIITNPIKVERMADNICKTFDTIAAKFYAPFEAERGFSIASDEGRTALKVPLVCVSAGIVSNTYRRISNYKTAMNIANDMKNLAKNQLYSGWVLDRPLLSGDEYLSEKKKLPYVVVIESDAALAYLLTTTLEMQGYVVDATSNKEEAIELINNNTPALVLIDAIIPGDDGWEICTYIREKQEFKSIKIIMATVWHDKEMALTAGADLYIPKPYELLSLHKWIDRLINEN